MNATTSPDTTTSTAPDSARIAPALLGDAAGVLHQLGLKSVRCAVVDMPSGAFHPGWSMVDSSAPGDGLDHALAGLRLIGAPAMLRQLDEASDEAATVCVAHSPSHWSLGWRIDDTRAVVAEARYHDARALLCEIDTALVRLLCNTGMLARHGSPVPTPSPALHQRLPVAPLMVAPAPASVPAPPRRARTTAALLLAGLAVTALVAALSAWPGGFAKATSQLWPAVTGLANR